MKTKAVSEASQPPQSRLNSVRKSLSRQSLSEQISAQLAEELMTGDLVPGQALILREVAAQFGVSQTPVREALLQLVSEGALEMSPSSSVRVPEASKVRLHELRELRVLIEGYAARMAALNATSAAIVAMRQIHEQMMHALRDQRMRDVLLYNKQFHMALYEQAGMPTTVAIIRQLWMRMAPYLNYLYSPKWPDPALTPDGHPHVMVLDALERRDPDGVQRALDWDLRHLQQHLNDNLSAVFGPVD